jgi:hypothetical protein
VDVGVDQSGQQHLVVRQLDHSGSLERILDRDDPAVQDADRPGPLPRRRDDPARPEHQVH